MHNAKAVLLRIRELNARPAALLLLMLLTADAAFVVLHIMASTMSFMASRQFAIDYDGGHAEYFQYMKFLWVVTLFVYLWIVTRRPGYLAWILLFGFFLADDAFRVHEQVGEYFERRLDFLPPLGLRAQDVGELVAWGCASSVLFTTLLLSYLRGTALFRKVSIDVALLVAGLIFFAAVVDMVAVVGQFGRTWKAIFVLIEDGGEMLMMSALLWYVFLLAMQKGEPTVFLHDALPTPISRALHLPQLVPARPTASFIPS